MKKLIVAAAALLISISSFAQFGITAGLTSSSSSLKDAKTELTSKSIAQYHVGITYKLALGNIIAIQPALVYNVKGAKMAELKNITDIDFTTDIDFKTGYIELPVQLQAGIGLGKLARVYGIAEPFVGYAISNEITGTTFKDKWQNVASKFEYGFGLGAGAEILNHLQVSLRYFWNLGDVYDYSFSTLSSTTKGKCNGITASVAFLF